MFTVKDIQADNSILENFNENTIINGNPGHIYPINHGLVVLNENTNTIFITKVINGMKNVVTMEISTLKKIIEHSTPVLNSNLDMGL